MNHWGWAQTWDLSNDREISFYLSYVTGLDLCLQIVTMGHMVNSVQRNVESVMLMSPAIISLVSVRLGSVERDFMGMNAKKVSS